MICGSPELLKLWDVFNFKRCDKSLLIDMLQETEEKRIKKVLYPPEEYPCMYPQSKFRRYDVKLND